MQLISKASHAFKKLSGSAKTTFGTNVLNALDSSSFFPALPVSMANLLLLNNALVTAVANKVNGGRAASLAYKAAVAAWDTAFISTAGYVSIVAAGDPAIIANSGFIPTKTESQAATKPGPIVAFNATINGSKGAIIAGAKKGMADAKAFVISAVPPGAIVTYVNNTMIVTLGENSIYFTATTRKETELYDLPSGVTFSVSMYAVNSAGSGPACAAQQVIPQ